MPATKWIIESVDEFDLDRVAEIGVACFNGSAINQYIRPLHLRRKLDDMSDTERRAALHARFRPMLKDVARKAIAPDGRCAGYAVWIRPDKADVKDESEGFARPKDPTVDQEAAKVFGSWLEGHDKRVLGERRRWTLLAIATHPDFSKQGAASALLQDGIDMAERTGCPIYFHSVPAAVSMYRRAGFRELETISTEYKLKDEDGRPAGTKRIELVAMTND